MITILEVKELQPEVDYTKIGQRIKYARIQQGYSQYELGKLVCCSNNHISHIETGQTKVSLTLLLKLSVALEKDINYFLLDTPYVNSETFVNLEIKDKLKKCNNSTLLAINKMIDILLEQQENLNFLL